MDIRHSQEPIALTVEERRNGWTPETLAAYRAERESLSAFNGSVEQGNVVSGFVVTEYVRPRPAIRMEGARTFNPHRWTR